MDKEEYQNKLNEIDRLVEQKDFEGAMAVVDCIDWRKVKDARKLTTVGEIYAANKRYEDSMEIFLLAYHRARIGKNILIRLIDISLKINQFEDAEEFYGEFEEIAPNDNTKYILKYKILKAKNAPLEEQIAVLEEYKDKEFTEKWSYELARLYYKADDRDKCLDLCDTIILWFNEGTYVMKTLDLKNRLGALTEEEKEQYDKQFASKPMDQDDLQALRKNLDSEDEKDDEQNSDADIIQIAKDKEEGSSVIRDTSSGNFQEKITKSLRDIFGIKKKSQSDDLLNPEIPKQDYPEQMNIKHSEDEIQDEVPQLEPEKLENEEPVSSESAEEKKASPEDTEPGNKTQEFVFKQPKPLKIPAAMKTSSLPDPEIIKQIMDERKRAEEEAAVSAQKKEEKKEEMPEFNLEATILAAASAQGIDLGFPKPLEENTEKTPDESEKELEFPAEDTEQEPELLIDKIARGIETLADKVEQEIKGSVDKGELGVKAPIDKDEPEAEVLTEEPEPEVEVSAEELEPEVEVPTEELEFEVEVLAEEPESEVEVLAEEPESEVEVSAEEPESEVEVSAEELEPEVEVPTEELESEVEVLTEEPESEVEVSAEELEPEVEVPAEELESEVEVPAEEPEVEVLTEEPESEVEVPAEQSELEVEAPAEEPEEDISEFQDLQKDIFSDSDALTGAIQEGLERLIREVQKEAEKASEILVEDVQEEDTDESLWKPMEAADSRASVFAASHMDDEELEKISGAHTGIQKAEGSGIFAAEEEEIKRGPFQIPDLTPLSEPEFSTHIPQEVPAIDPDIEAETMAFERAIMEKEERKSFSLDDLEAKIGSHLDSPDEDKDSVDQLLEREATPEIKQFDAKVKQILSETKKNPEELTEEEKLENFIDSIHSEDVDPTKIIPRKRELTKEEETMFSYFVKVPGMKEQIIDMLCDVQSSAADKTSRTGNIIVMGARETGKTHLISNIIPAICKELYMEAAKVAYVFAEQINGKDMAKIISKLSGGFLVIENANQLDQETAESLNKALEFRTDGLTVIVEDEKIGMRKFLARYPKLAKKFTSMINIPVFTNDELVNFAKIYTRENGYSIDQMGMLALYNCISQNQKADEPMTIGSVKTMLDEAIAKSQSGMRKLFSKKRTDRDGLTVLCEKDFI